MTLPTTYSWGPRGVRLIIPYEAPQGRRINVIGAYITHGPAAGKFEFVSFASLPKTRGKAADPATTAAKHGLTVDEVGVIDSQLFLGFLWELAGRPADAGPGWQRAVPLEIWLDNYSVHKCEVVQRRRAELERANVTLKYLPAYCPELSGIEHVWHDVKHYRLTQRSYKEAGDLKQAVDLALTQKASAIKKSSASLAAPA
jgi:hypothetical protein